MELCLKVGTTEASWYICAHTKLDRSDSQVSFYTATVPAKPVPLTAKIVDLYTPARLRLLLALYATSAAETTYPPLYSHCLAVDADTVSLNACARQHKCVESMSSSL